VVLTFGVALVHAGHEIGDPVAAVGSVVVLGDMLLSGGLSVGAYVLMRLCGRLLFQPSKRACD
jgi:hypothetical protein